MNDLLTKLKNTRVAIIGAGYLGRHIYNFLSEHSSEKNIDLVVFTRSNISNITQQTFDYVFNCAGNTGDFRHKISETIESNLSLASFVLNNCTIRKTYVAISSTRIYGYSEDRNKYFSEDQNIIVDSSHLSIDYVYNGTKVLLESVVWNLQQRSNCKIIICRLSNIFGRFFSKDLDNSTLLKLMISNTINKVEFEVNQNLSSTKDYIYIDDAVLGIIKCAVYSLNSDVFNVASGQSYSLKKWIEYLGLNVTNSKSFLPTQYSNISIEKIFNKVGFKPTFSLDNLHFNQIYQDGC
jgi:nucleoside-diphosphate-sugar epimerase